MNNYSYFTQNETKDKNCPILADSALLKSTDHPKKIILIKMESVMKPFYTLALWEWVTNHRTTNPLTNMEINSFDLERINFYKESIDRYPDITLSQTKQIIHEILDKFFQTGESPSCLTCVNPFGKCPHRSVVYYFADIEDFKPYLFKFSSDISFRKGSTQVLSLFSNSKYWILRKTSLMDSPGEHEHYGISNNTGHCAIRHSFGQGYWGISGKVLTAKFLAPSFMGALEYYKKSLRDLVRGENHPGRLTLTLNK